MILKGHMLEAWLLLVGFWECLDHKGSAFISGLLGGDRHTGGPNLRE